jgi:hypothetical protein
VRRELRHQLPFTQVALAIARANYQAVENPAALIHLRLFPDPKTPYPTAEQMIKVVHGNIVGVKKDRPTLQELREGLSSAFLRLVALLKAAKGSKPLTEVELNATLKHEYGEVIERMSGWLQRHGGVSRREVETTIARWKAYIDLFEGKRGEQQVNMRDAIEDAILTDPATFFEQGPAIIPKLIQRAKNRS